MARATFAVLVERVKRCIDAGVIAGDARIAALGFHALCQGLASEELFGSPVVDADFRRLWREALTAYVAGFRPAGKKRGLHLC